MEERIRRLLDAMTLDEKMHQLASGSGGIERLGIPECRLGGEAAHGVEARNDQNGIGDPDITTSFPQPVGMSSSWDTDAIRAAGDIVGREARTVYNRRKWGGISRWAPTVDLLRDPRWGRNEEAYGEDPVQVGAMASAYIRGIQGDDPDHLMCAATLKHFYANNTEIGRGWKNSSVSPRNRYELYLEPFRRCIEDGGAEGVMTAYNRINGVQGLFCSEVKTLLKDEFGLTHAVSDGGAMELSAAFSHVTAMDAETVARSIRVGVDALSGRPGAVYAAVKEAWELGLLTKEDMDEAIANVYRTKFKLGIADEDASGSDPIVPGSEEAGRICKELTDRSIVLLKNDGILPLENIAYGKCVLAGPVGDKWYQDWYGGAAAAHISLLEGLKANASEKGGSGEVVFTDGCDRIRIKSEDKYLSAEADGRIRLSDEPDTYVMEDWGEGSYTFRCEQTGQYLITRLTGEQIEGIAAAEDGDGTGADIKGRLYADTDRIFSWFDLEVFRLSPARDASAQDRTLIMRDRFGNRLYADRDGYIVSAAGEPQGLIPLSVSIETVRSGIEEAVSAASGADTVILALGHNPMVNAKEEIDRSTIEFIPYQQRLFDEVYKVNPNIVVVLMSDYPYAINEIDKKARAVLWSATGSQCMGQSLADALEGKICPAGRLTQTWYVSDDDLPDIDDYDIIGRGRTYRYFEGDVLYPFGFGLTYTSFEYTGLKTKVLPSADTGSDTLKRRSGGQPVGVYDGVRADGRVLEVEVTLTNTGDVTSDEVLQVYAQAPKRHVKCPLKQLIGFSRVKDMTPGESRTITLHIPIRELAYYDVISEALVVEKGRYEIKAASSSMDPGITEVIDIDGTEIGLRDTTGRIKADHYDVESGTQIVEGMYGYSALMALDPGVYEPPVDGHISATYRDCAIPEGAGTCRIHGYAPQDADIRIYVDDTPAGSIRLNTRDYERKPSEARNHMPRAATAEELRKRSWPLLWADIYIPLDLSAIRDQSPDIGHEIRIEADGPFKYDWFSLI